MVVLILANFRVAPTRPERAESERTGSARPCTGYHPSVPWLCTVLSHCKWKLKSELTLFTLVDFTRAVALPSPAVSSSSLVDEK